MERLKKFKLTRGKVAFFSIVGSYVALRYWDKHEIEKIKIPALKKSQEIGDQPMEITEKPRSLLVIVNRVQKGGSDFERYSKPFFDAAALDYDIVEVSRIGEAKSTCKEISNFSSYEGVVAVGTSVFREVVTGMKERQEEKDKVLPIGYIPVRHLYGWRWMLSHFDDRTNWQYTIPFALSIALDHTKPMEESDLKLVASYEDPKELSNYILAERIELDRIASKKREEKREEKRKKEEEERKRKEEQGEHQPNFFERMIDTVKSFFKKSEPEVEEEEKKEEKKEDSEVDAKEIEKRVQENTNDFKLIQPISLTKYHYKPDQQ